TGTWQVSLDLIAAPGSPISILAFATSPRDGSITASASVDVLYGGEEGTVVHLVQRGETLGTISIQYGVPIQEIMTANGLTNADYIYAGQQLIIPAP
ncbi:MAG: LysM peptidoglycan-binding domain-containing protein, partial [Candidatus Promineifilaceae bacterium]